MKKFLAIAVSSLIVSNLSVAAGQATTPTHILDLTPDEMSHVVRIGRSIHTVNARLEENKLLEYAVGIYRASSKYGIDPEILVAITQQESQFREDLPEGAAGERGICQIIKSWLQNPKLKADFKGVAMKDLHKPSRAFEIAAWILSDLRDGAKVGALPFWSFYNSRKFENRLKYYLAVNKYIAIMRRNERLIASPTVRMAALKKQVAEQTIAKPQPKVQLAQKLEPQTNQWIAQALKQSQGRNVSSIGKKLESLKVAKNNDEFTISNTPVYLQ